MSARAEILNRLRSMTRAEILPPAWSSKRAFTDLAARFTESLTAAKGEVRRAESLDSAWREIDTILHEVQARAMVANDELPLNGVALARLRMAYCRADGGKFAPVLRTRRSRLERS